jgi:uncharacterized protein YbbK (DUF523 family)
VLTRDKAVDVTAAFLKGAHGVAGLARTFGARLAILKSRSPSCGHGAVYREGQVVEGNGTTAALLLRHGVRIISGDVQVELTRFVGVVGSSPLSR